MIATYENLGTASERGPYAPYLVDCKQLGTLPAHVAELRYPGGSRTFTSRPEFSLTRTIRIDKPGAIENEFGKRDHRRYKPGDLEVAVPFTSGTWTTEGDTHLRMMALPVAEIERILEDQSAAFKGDFGALHHAPFRSEPMLALFDQVWSHTRSGCPTANLLVEGLFMAIVAQLLLLSKTGGTTRPARGHTLPDRVLRQIDDYIVETADANLYTKDLASLAGMPLTAFARALKTKTGKTPHQYVLQRRVELARDLITHSTLSLAQVAFEAGFSSQSHMTDVLRNRLGVTPGQIRKQVG